MTSAPIITVLLPTIGRERFLDESLARLDAQTFDDYEAIILDNASPPAARARYEAFAASRPRVRIMRLDERVGIFPNFNRGIQAARGKYVAFMFDDDVYRPEFLARHVEILERYPTAVMSGGNFNNVDEDLKHIRTFREFERTELWPGDRFIDIMLSRGRNPLANPGVVYRRDILGDGYDPALSAHYGDFVQLMRWAERGDIAVLDEILFDIRKHDAAASSSVPLSAGIPMRTETLLDYCDEYASRHPERADHMERMKVRIRLQHRLALVYGALFADGDDEARACADAVGSTVADAAVAGAVKAVRSTGLLGAETRGKLAKVAYTVGAKLRL